MRNKALFLFLLVERCYGNAHTLKVERENFIFTTLPPIQLWIIALDA